MTNDVAPRFARETEQHEMTIEQDDGLYRHLKFRHKGPNYSGYYWFDLITVPGTLIFQGDGDSYVFSRVPDMFEFFRSPLGRINPIYWAEKLTSRHGDDAKTYDEEIFTACVNKEVAEVTEDGALPGLAAAVQREIFEGGSAYFEAGARESLEQFEFYLNDDDRWDPDKRPDFRFEDTWEMSFRDYDWWFLWACQAIVWGIASYDAVKAGRQVPRLPVVEDPVVTVHAGGDLL